MTFQEHPRSPHDALAQFRRWAADPRLVILDTETTGLDGDVVELAVTDLWERPLLDLRVRPTTPFTERAIELHGIRPEDVAHLPLISAHVQEVQSVLEGRVVVTYGAAFDTASVTRSFEHALPGGPVTPLASLLTDWGCVMNTYADLAAVPDQKGRGNHWFALLAACERERVQVGDLPLHRAMGDARLTARLIRQVGQAG